MEFSKNYKIEMHNGRKTTQTKTQPVINNWLKTNLSTLERLHSPLNYRVFIMILSLANRVDIFLMPQGHHFIINLLLLWRPSAPVIAEDGC